MTRHMFIATHNHWFSRLTLLASMIVLFCMLFEIYGQLLHFSWGGTLPPYITSSTALLAIFLTLSASVLHRELGMIPLVLCLALLALPVSFYMLEQWFSLPELTLSLIQMTFHVISIIMLWWLSVMTGPHHTILTNERDKKFRPWAWINTLLLFGYIIVSIAVILTQASSICSQSPECAEAFIPALNLPSLAEFPDQHSLTTLFGLSRIVTLILVGYLIFFSLFILTQKNLGEITLFVFLFSLVMVNITIGHYFYANQVWMILAELIVAFLLLFTMISLLVRLYRRPV